MDIDVFHEASFDVDVLRLRNARFLIEYHSIHFGVRLRNKATKRVPNLDERVVNLRTDG
jgi:hypothetical protein